MRFTKHNVFSILADELPENIERMNSNQINTIYYADDVVLIVDSENNLNTT